jgi:hypothetical protein
MTPNVAITGRTVGNIPTAAQAIALRTPPPSVNRYAAKIANTMATAIPKLEI